MVRLWSNSGMGRKRHGNAAKQRHTITIDPEVVVRLALVSEWMLEARTTIIEIISIRAMVMASGLPFTEFPICGQYRTDFRVLDRYVFITFDTPSGERVSGMFPRRRNVIVVAPSASASDPRVVDLVGFGALLRRLRKPRRDAGAVTNIKKKRRAAGKNGSLVAPATR